MSVKFYAYTNKTRENANGQKVRAYTFLGTIKAEDDKKAMKEAKKQWPKASFIDLLYAKYVADKQTGALDMSDSPWIDTKKKGKKK